MRNITDQANSSVEKAGIMGTIKMRLLPTDENGNLCQETFIETLQNDCNNGLFPSYVSARLFHTFRNQAYYLCIRLKTPILHLRWWLLWVQLVLVFRKN